MSMPVTNLDIRGRENDLPDLASVLGHINTTGYLFGDEDTPQNSAASPDVKTYLQMNTTDDKFPILVRRDGNGNGSMQLSASSAALDLALSQSPGPESNGWPGYRHRQSQQSLPANTLRKASQVDEYEVREANGKPVESTPTKNNRRSVEFGFSPFNTESKRSSYHASPSAMPKLQQSYSTNDIPTVKNGNGINGINGINASGAVNSHAEQHLHNHNAILGRVPPNAISHRHSRELSTGFKDADNAYRPLQSALHASAAPFGPAITSATSANGLATTMASPTASQYSTTNASTAPYYGGYGMSMLNGAMNGLTLGPQPPPAYGYNAGGYMPPLPSYNQYTTYGPGGRIQDSQARVIQSRRLQNGKSEMLRHSLRRLLM